MPPLRPSVEPVPALNQPRRRIRFWRGTFEAPEVEAEDSEDEEEEEHQVGHVCELTAIRFWIAVSSHIRGHFWKQPIDSIDFGRGTFEAPEVEAEDGEDEEEEEHEVGHVCELTALHF